MTEQRGEAGHRPARDDVREAVLEAARACFAEHGYRAVALDQIAERAGFSKGAIYSNFESKADLFLHLHTASVLDRVDDALAALAPAGDDLDAVVTAAAEAIVAMIRLPTAGPLMAEVLSEAERDPLLRTRLAGVRLERTVAVAERVEAFLAGIGAEPVMPAVELIRVVNSLVTGLALEAVGTEGTAIIEPATVAGFMAPLVREVPADS